MTVVFVSNYYNHHQAPFSEEMHRLTDGHYYFIATEPMEEERVNMGWNVENFPQFVKFWYKNDQSKSECQSIIDSADVVIFGSAPYALIKSRLQHGKLTFRYSERLYKSGLPDFLHRCYHTLIHYFQNSRYNDFYLLCSSAYTSADYCKLFCYRNKAYKWGYFPATERYDNIEGLISRKLKHSILWTARFIKWKHPEMPILLAHKLKQEGFDFHINMIGSGEMFDEIQDMIHSYNLDNEVTLLGSMRPDKVRTYMEQSEIFLFNSDRNEGWGAVLNESMNSGCAVVASHSIGSVPFLIRNGENGYIYKDGDFSDFYAKVTSLLNNDFLSHKMGINAYQTITEEWCAETAAQRFLSLVSVLRKNGQTPFKQGPCSVAEILDDNWK